jgi:hypothetical protein
LHHINRQEDFNMQGDAPVSWLMFFTLAAAIFIIAGAFIRFLHSQRNRDIAAAALAGDNSPTVAATPNGALPDLAGVLVFALIAMGLLAFGYSRKSAPETVPSPPVAGGSMAQPVGIADKPKVYQPVNPAPDPRSAPTSSGTGVGSDNGGRPEEQPKQ